MRMLMAVIVAAGLAAPAVSAEPGYEEARIVVKTLRRVMMKSGSLTHCIIVKTIALLTNLCA